MASRPALYVVLVGVHALMFPGVKAYNDKEHRVIQTVLFWNNTNYPHVECCWRNSDDLAGVTLYDVQKEKDVYVSGNSKNECKTKSLLGRCALNETWMSLTAVISNPPYGKTRLFACNATWFEPDKFQQQVLINVSHNAGDLFCSTSANEACLESSAAVTIIVILALVAVAGWVTFCICFCRMRKKETDGDAEKSGERVPLKNDTSDGHEMPDKETSVDGARDGRVGANDSDVHRRRNNNGMQTGAHSGAAKQEAKEKKQDEKSVDLDSAGPGQTGSVASVRRETVTSGMQAEPESGAARQEDKDRKQDAQNYDLEAALSERYKPNESNTAQPGLTPGSKRLPKRRAYLHS